MAYSNTYSKEEQKALAKQKVEKALAKIEVDVISIFDNESFPEYLRFAANFHYFDVNNALLVYNQRPSATFLTSFKAWEKYSLENYGDVNRPVLLGNQKGKGVGILAPYILKKKVSDAEGQRFKVVSYLDYHIVFVFDKAQTYDIPVPVMSWDLSKSKDDCLALFNAFCEKAPFSIVFDEQCSYKYSFEESDDANKKSCLALNPNVKDNYFIACSYIVKSFVIQSLAFLKKHYSRDDFQKICECVSYMLSCYFGLPAEQYSFFFAKIWGGNNPDKMMGILNVVQNSVHKLIVLLEEEVVFYKSLLDTSDIYNNDDVFGFNEGFDF